MDPAFAAPLSVIAAAIATAIIAWASYRWPRGYHHDPRAIPNDRPEDPEGPTDAT